jgi:uncharacterized RDD family membrane protein YckC
MDSANPYAPPQAPVHDVVDPNAPLELAGRGTRLAAALVDGLIMMLIAMPMIVVFAAAGATGADDTVLGAAGLIGGLLTILAFLAWAVITTLLVMNHGQTLGKRALGIRVMRSDGTPAGLGRIFWLRNVVNGLLGVIPAYSIIDHLFIFGESHQCLHDKIADTIVVRA